MHNILLIEDEEDLRESISDILTLEGYHVISSFDGQAGFNLSAKTPPDLILCDIMMPNTDGFEVLSKLKELDQTAVIPFIFITALAERQNQRKGMELGADDYLTKPFTREELLKAINNQKIKQKVQENTINQELRDLQKSIVLSLPHEFITNLGLVMGFSELIKELSSEIDHHEIFDMSQKILESGKKLHAIVKKYLIYLELEIVKSTKPVLNLNEIRMDLTHLMNRIATQYQREEDCVVNLDECQITINREYFYFALEQIIDNAFKFSKAGQSVHLKSEATKSGVTLTVSDQGYGFPVDSLRRINAFKQFKRREFEQQGIGLGLFLAKTIIIQAGGTLIISNNSPQGTIVKMGFPIAETIFNIT